MVDLHTHDKTKAFVKFDTPQRLSVGLKVYVTIEQNKKPSSGIVSGWFSKNEDKIKLGQTLSFEQVKPGFWVECRVKKVVDNGIHVSICNGIEGVIFEDCLEKSLSAYVKKEMFDAWVTYIDYQKW